MNSKRLQVISVLLAICVSAVVAGGQSQPAPPDLSGKWNLVSGSLEADSPLGREGTIAQNGKAVTFRSSASRSIDIPFDGSKTTSQDNAVAWEYQGTWMGSALVVSMKARNRAFGSTFEDFDGGQLQRARHDDVGHNAHSDCLRPSSTYLYVDIQEELTLEGSFNPRRVRQPRRLRLAFSGAV